jgi:rSAM/selenodomain-associated transferase 2/rSAM/selenodomain-associated transferase 1
MISIIIPLLNEKDIIPDLLVYLTEIKDQECEIILVDGGSIDGSINLLQESNYPFTQSVKGRAAQMNHGAALAKGELFIFLHADTVLSKNALQLIQEISKTKKEAWGRFDISITSYQTSSFTSRLLLSVIAFFINWRSRLTSIATGDQAIFITRQLFTSVGGFPSQPLMEDIEISKRLRKITAPICLTEKAITSGRRWHKQGVLRTVLLMWRLRWQYWRGHSIEKIAASYALNPSESFPRRRESQREREKKIRIVIIAKAPIEGFAKTRLIPALGIQGAADVAKKLLQHTINQVAEAQLNSVELCVAPDKNHAAWQEVKIPNQFIITNQIQGDLGARLAEVTKRTIDAEEAVILIGTDCPSIDAKLLEKVALLLEEKDTVIIPATDGGYVLLALNYFDKTLFTNISWSTETVYAETINRIESLNWNYISLPAMHDIDTEDDLKNLQPISNSHGF